MTSIAARRLLFASAKSLVMATRGKATTSTRTPPQRITEVSFMRITKGIGFNRSLEQYCPEVREQFGNPNSCPQEFLLWFHRLPWDHRLPDGRILLKAILTSTARTPPPWRDSWPTGGHSRG